MKVKGKATRNSKNSLTYNLIEENHIRKKMERQLALLKQETIHGDTTLSTTDLFIALFASHRV